MNRNLIIVLTIWEVALLIALVIGFFTHEITAGSYYLGLIGCGIWLTLINIYADKE